MARILDAADAAERDRYRARSAAEATCGAQAPDRAGKNRVGLVFAGIAGFLAGLTLFPKKAMGAGKRRR